jgi:hypothetical protein
MQQHTNTPQGPSVPTHVTNVVSYMHVDPDLLLMGRGSAGCLAALAARAHAPAVAVTILERGGERNTRGEHRYF